MKKMTLFLCFIVLLLLCFAGCSEGQNQNSSDSGISDKETGVSTDTEGEVVQTWADTTFDGLSEEELQPYFDAVLDFVEEYYRTVYAADGYAAVFFENALPRTEQIETYLKQKLEYERIFGKVLGYTTTYVDGAFQILDWKTFGDTLVCKVAVALQTRYSDTGTGTYSGWEVQIVLQNPRDPNVSDGHIDDVKADPFETQVRGYGVDLFDPENWLISADPTALEQRITEVMQDRRDAAENTLRQRDAALGG